VVQLGDAAGTWVAIPGSPAAVLPHCLRLWGNVGPLAEERFATIEARSRNLEACVELIGRYAATFDSFERFEQTMSEGARLPVGRLVDLADTVDADWAIDRAAFVDVASGDETVRVHRSPLRISGADCGPRSGVKHLGADNRPVLAEVLGLSDAEIDKLSADGALVEEPVGPDR
jgi:crotonobetainyl-CoA:carnitine CoA-transferase CaiB-like acyl-CoA transferase